ncbi:hypothetical protein BCR33DRAFT_742671 [Rhizoclosmatium globosum]|uniref:Bulb-type lectin domain-containing protein n=1 Tax=Rhizoclosmatium globosum TaxID=329046 RepID=A0A1Y2BRG1_9FUNG|nr:hypothetical protein BCR33DRAFT_742671 [Rhizoclosmatium globosum]|eukprot:ORY36725.1 hypothetical protein BCR33DRAFT_742671 [Rhizoclosmatium globosum]
MIQLLVFLALASSHVVFAQNCDWWFNSIYNSPNTYKLVRPKNDGFSTCLPVYESFYKCTYLMSPDGRTTLTLQQDGNLVALHYEEKWDCGPSTGKSCWVSSGTRSFGEREGFRFMCAETSSAPVFMVVGPTGDLCVRNDGRIVLYSDDGAREIWSVAVA